jgi:hypothetical protein
MSANELGSISTHFYVTITLSFVDISNFDSKACLYDLLLSKQPIYLLALFQMSLIACLPVCYLLFCKTNPFTLLVSQCILESESIFTF